MPSFLTKISDSKVIFFAFYSVLSVGSVTCAYLFVLDYSVDLINYTYLFGMTLLFIFGLLLFGIFLRNYYRKTEWVFVLIGIPVSCAFAFFVLPNYVPDEIWHIYKIFDVPASVGGGSLTVSSLLSFENLPHSYADYRSILFSQEEVHSQIEIERNLPYSFILYIIPGIICAPLQFFGVHAFVLIIVARLVNAALFLGIGFLVIRILPFGKNIAMIYMLSPMVIQQAASCSADCLTNAFSLLFIALMLKMNSDKKLSWKVVVVALLLLLAIAVAKYAYALLGLLWLLFLPRIKSKAMRWSILVGIIVFTILGLIAMRALSIGGLTIGYMLDLIFSPLYGFNVLYETLLLTGEFYCLSFLGAYLGNLDIMVWKPALFLFGALLVASLFVSVNEETSLRKWDKGVLWVVFAVIFVLVIIAQRQWSIEQHGLWHVIEGVQGRYFIPVALLPLLALFSSKTYIRNDKFLLVVTPLICFIQLCAIVAIVRFFV